VTSLAAQQSQPRSAREGWWLGFGLGPGESSGEGNEPIWAPSGYLRFGDTAQPNLLWGLEALGWAGDRSDTSFVRGNAHVMVMWYPSVKDGFYLKGGLGVGAFRESHSSGNTTDTNTRVGFGLGFGLGWELRMGGNLYLVPSVDLPGQFFGSESAFGVSVPDAGGMFMANLGLTWH
jgi:hypothetical protein